MMKSSRSPRRSASACGFLLLLTAGAISQLPEEVSGGFRRTVRDLLVPGQRLVLAMQQQWPASLPELSFSPGRSLEAAGADARTSSSAVDSATTATSQSELRLHARKLEAENAALRQELEELRRQSALPVDPGTTLPLLMPEMIEARLLGQRAASLWREGGLLDQGTHSGIRESSLVLADESPLLDQGQTSGLAPGQPVFAGRTVLGRVQQAGRWSSTLLPVTDPRFRGLAQLVRQTAAGTVSAGQGILEGQGEKNCLLRFVDATEPVTPGDAVFTAADESDVPWPMYYGRVVRATLPKGAAWWEIEVEPASRSLHPRVVQILTTAVNPARLSHTAEESPAEALR